MDGKGTGFRIEFVPKWSGTDDETGKDTHR